MRRSKGSVFLSTLILIVMISVMAAHAEILRGTVTSIQGKVIEFNIGAEKGIRVGDPGKVYYNVKVEGKEQPIYIAKVRITRVSERSATAQIEEKTTDLRTGLSVEVTITLGELEVKSEPSGAKVSVDGKEMGQTPLALSAIRMGQHRIRIEMEGHHPHEEQIDLTGPERKRVAATLRKLTGELLVNTDPPGAGVSIDGRPVGTSPYEGKAVSPGTFRVKTIKEGYETWEKDIVVEAGKKLEVFAQMKAKEGALEVQSDPPGARVYLDGKEVGETPLALSGIHLGQHLVQVTKEGYESHEERVTVVEGEEKKFLAFLKKLGGDLSISTEPSGASISINGKSVGLSPYEGKTLPPGTHKVRIVKEGYETWEKNVVVGVGKRVEVLAQLKAKEGGLEIFSEPSGAKVYIDEIELGQTPFVLSKVQLGQHRVRVVKEGYEQHEERVSVVEGERKRVVVSLRKIAGGLAISTEPTGASVNINGKPVGTSPYEGRDLQPGTYKVKAVKEGYETREMDAVVKAGEWSEVRIELKEKKKEVVARPPPSPPAKPETKPEPTKRIETKAPEAPKPSRDIDWSKRSCEAPIWKVGDKWTYRKADGVVFIQEVVDIKEDAFIMKIPGLKDLHVYDKKTMNRNYSIGKNGRRVSTSDEPFKRLFEFPLFVGKTWSYTTPWGRDNTCVNDFKVERVEEVQTRAGKFVAYRIYCKGKVLAPAPSSSQRHESWAHYWYSPEVKWWVKREFDKTGYWSGVIHQDTELVSYKLK